MTQAIPVTRTKLGLEDINFGSGIDTQTRQKIAREITRLNAENFPYNALLSLKERLDIVKAGADIVEDLGPQLQLISDNIAKLILLKQVVLDGTNGNAGFLEGQTLAQVRSGINAAQLQGSDLTATRAGINAAQLEGQTLAQVRSGINAAQLQGSDLAAVRAGIDAATLEGMTLAQVREGGNAALLTGSDVDAIQVAFVDAVPNANTVIGGKIELATVTEVKTGSATDVVPTVGLLANAPMQLMGWMHAKIVKIPGQVYMESWAPNGNKKYRSMFGFTINTTDWINNFGTMTAPLANTITGYAVIIPAAAFATGTTYVNSPCVVQLTNTNTLTIPSSVITTADIGPTPNYTSGVEIFIMVFGKVD